MKIKEQVVKDLDVLEPKDVVVIYDLIQSLKHNRRKETLKPSSTAYLRVRSALASCQGNLSDDIDWTRKDRG